MTSDVDAHFQTKRFIHFVFVKSILIYHFQEYKFYNSFRTNLINNNENCVKIKLIIN